MQLSKNRCCFVRRFLQNKLYRHAQTGNPPLHNLSPNTTGEDSVYMAKISTQICSPLGRDPKKHKEI